ncbi:hypothetical protein MTO96_045817 [Rhipicephalus appendiculatus]
MWFVNGDPMPAEQSHGSGGRDSSGSGHRSVVVDETAPFMHGSSSSRACPQPCGLSVICIVLCLVWIVGVAAILLLWLLPAPAEGTRAHKWRDGMMAAIGLVVSLVSFVSIFNILFYCVYLRRRAGYAETDGSSV